MHAAEKVNYGAENMDTALAQELKGRWAKLEKIMRERSLDAILLVGNSVVGPPFHGTFRYFTGHKVYYRYQAMIARPDKPITVCASSVQHKNGLAARGLTDIRVSPDILGTVLTDLKDQPVKRLGVSLEMLPALWYLELEKTGAAFVDVLGDICAIRSERSDFEIEMTRACGKIADAGYRAVCDKAAPGVKLTDLYAELDYAMKAAGAEETFTLMSCGRFSFEDNKLPCISPLIWPEDSVVKNGDCVAMEITPRYMGYWTQMVRTICVGEQNPDIKKAHADLLKTMEAAIPLFKPGIRLEDTIIHMCKVGESLGYASRLPFGHIAGIDLDEGWHYALESDIILKAGMTFIIHPTLITPNIDFGIFWGDSYLVTEDGGQCLTSCENALLTV